MKNNKLKNWFKLKVQLAAQENQNKYTYQREIWLSHIGQNLGTEVYGKGIKFLRPVIVIKPIINIGAITIPLTSQKHKGSFFYNFIDQSKTQQCAILNQIKYIDARRLSRKISRISRPNFYQLLKKLSRLLKGTG